MGEKAITGELPQVWRQKKHREGRPGAAEDGVKKESGANLGSSQVDCRGAGKREKEGKPEPQLIHA